MQTNISALNGIRTHDSSIRGGEDGSWFRQRSYCDGRRIRYTLIYSYVPKKSLLYKYSV
jgi:hypothetical protein